LREIEKLQQRGLARARGAGEEVKAALAELEIEVAQDLGTGAVAQSYAVEFNDRGQLSSLPTAAWKRADRRQLAIARSFLFTLRLSSRKRAFAQ
jgi:hypothetical protein